MPAPPRIIATRLESAGNRGEDRILVDHREDHDIIAVADGAGGTGAGRSVAVSFAIPRAAGRLLVATDGLFAYAPPRDIAALVRDGDLEHAASALLQRVRLRSGALADDVAIVLYDLDDAPHPTISPPPP